ncbi:MAG TPA: 30S ribosomal protein S7 [Candidatus Eisenbacteria bacterium]|jgi:small subunit ribosomal protein S7|nr:30S ribosomal protein S7 [Candidatus Eisenbacteria bacterium]HEX3112255.1 30S ribosomal protein S7 [Candidatus Eisenbacteria bacterium]
MRRAAKIHRVELAPDARYANVLVTRFINCLMLGGKKSTAERIFYGAMDVIEKKTGQDGLSVLKTAMNNVKPVLEVKSRRVGGATYQVPVEVRQDRRTALALRWLIQYSRSRPDHTMADRLAAEITAASKNEGGAVKKREDTHKMAEANKAFAHYRW